jgi:hypothetical protein
MTDPRPTTEAELIEQIRSLDVPAPESLHRQVEAMIAGKKPAGASLRAGLQHGGGGGRAFRFGPRLAAGGAFAAVLIALAIVVALSGGGSSTLNVRDASKTTIRAASGLPPAESRSDGRELAAAVDGVSFPYWGAHFGWRATGSRTDRVDGRTITTIFYANRRGQRIGYAIVAGTSPAQMSGGVVSMRDGTPYRLLTVNGRAVVSWLRQGHLCVVSGRGVDGATLLRLASWDEHRSVAS